MRALFCACLFVVACKTESKAPAPATSPAATSDAPRKPDRARPRPELPGEEPSNEEPRPPRVRPQLPEEPRDWGDPVVREEMRQRREERRARREEMLDTNKDGVVSPEERRQRLVPMLERLDADGDGKLTPDELASSERRMAFDDPAAVDTDKNGEISLEELEAAVNTRRDQMRARWRGGRRADELPPD